MSTALTSPFLDALKAIGNAMATTLNGSLSFLQIPKLKFAYRLQTGMKQRLMEAANIICHQIFNGFERFVWNGFCFYPIG